MPWCAFTLFAPSKVKPHISTSSQLDRLTMTSGLSPVKSKTVLSSPEPMRRVFDFGLTASVILYIPAGSLTVSPSCDRSIAAAIAAESKPFTTMVSAFTAAAVSSAINTESALTSRSNPVEIMAYAPSHTTFLLVTPGLAFPLFGRPYLESI